MHARPVGGLPGRSPPGFQPVPAERTPAAVPAVPDSPEERYRKNRAAPAASTIDRSVRPRVPARLPQDAAHGRGRVLILTVLALVVLATIAFAVVPAFRYALVPPFSSTIEDRLNRGDPRGNGGPYSVSATFFGENNDTLRVDAHSDPEAGESIILLGDTTRHDLQDEYAIITKERTERYRNYVSQNNVVLYWTRAAFDVTNRTDRMYTGVVNNRTFELNVTSDGRFEELRVLAPENDTTMAVLVYDYEEYDFPAYPIRAPRGRCDLEIPSGVPPPNTNIRINATNMDDAVRPTELEIHFLASNATVLRKIGFESIVNVGYQFRWVDLNHNTFVDRGDYYQYKVPAEVTRVRIMDEWAEVYIDAVPRLELPGFGPVAFLAAAGVSALLVKRARRTA